MNFDAKSFDRPVLSPQIAKLILRKLGDYGVPAERLLDSLDFDAAWLDKKDTFLSFNQMFALIDRALLLSNVPWLGLEIGKAQTIGTWGALGYAIMSSANEIEAVEIGPKYYQAAPSVMHLDSRIDGDRLRLQMDPIYPAERLIPFCVEENLLGITTVSSEYLQEPMPPLEIHLSYPKPIYAEKYAEYFDCPIFYDQPANIIWTRRPTDRPLRTSDPASAEICLKLAEELVARHRGEDDFLLELRKELLKDPGSMPSMEEIASTLGMTSRTLRRRLNTLGLSFRDLRDDVRKNLAFDFLDNTALNIDQIASRLGYTEPTNFRRAFKQWTSLTPSRYRQDKSPF